MAGSRALDVDAEERRPQGRPMDVRLDVALREATIDVLYHHGYSGLTTARVAQAAGVSTATLYRRWANKHALLLDVAASVVRDSSLTCDTGSFKGDIRALLEDTVRILSGRMGVVLRAIVGEAAQNSQVAELLEAASRESFTGRFSAVLSRAVTRGEIPPPAHPALSADLAVGPLVMQTLLGGGLKPDLVEHLLPYVLHLFGAAES